MGLRTGAPFALRFGSDCPKPLILGCGPSGDLDLSFTRGLVAVDRRDNPLFVAPVREVEFVDGLFDELWVGGFDVAQRPNHVVVSRFWLRFEQ